MPMATGQAGRLFENLVENAYTAQSGGRLASWLPVLDSRGVDRAVEVGCGPPLFLQVKEHVRPRRDGRLSFAVPESGVGAYDRWLAAFVAGDPDEGRLQDCYLVPGQDFLQHAERGTLTDGRPCLRATLSPGSPTWAQYRTGPGGLGEALLQRAAAGPLLPRPQLERQQEEGARFEAALTALLLEATDRVALYRPAVDFQGRDLLVQEANADAYLYIQVKGTTRQDVPGRPRFQVRRRTFAPDPRLLFVFLYEDATAWAVPAPDLAERASKGDQAHISFEPDAAGADRRWGEYRCERRDLAERVLARL